MSRVDFQQFGRSTGAASGPQRHQGSTLRVRRPDISGHPAGRAGASRRAFAKRDRGHSAHLPGAHKTPIAASAAMRVSGAKIGTTPGDQGCTHGAQRVLAGQRRALPPQFLSRELRSAPALRRLRLSLRARSAGQRVSPQDKGTEERKFSGNDPWVVTARHGTRSEGVNGDALAQRVCGAGKPKTKHKTKTP